MRTVFNLLILMIAAVSGLQCGSNTHGKTARTPLNVESTSKPTIATYADAQAAKDEAGADAPQTVTPQANAAAVEARVALCHKSPFSGRKETIYVPIDRTTSFLRQPDSYVGECIKDKGTEWMPEPGDRCSTTWGAPVSCDDGNTCTSDHCDADVGCTFKPAHDGYACKESTFARGINTVCSNGQCVPTEKGSCDDGDPRTEDMIATDVPHCIHKPISAYFACDDGDKRTIDAFDDNGQCTHTVQPKAGNAPCKESDNNLCTTAMAVTIGTDTLCVEVLSPDGTSCNDNRPCTKHDVCIKGVCQGTPIDCSKKEQICTGSYCDEKTGSCVEFKSLKIAADYLKTVAEGGSPSEFGQCDLKGTLRTTVVLKP